MIYSDFPAEVTAQDEGGRGPQDSIRGDNIVKKTEAPGKTSSNKAHFRWAEKQTGYQESKVCTSEHVQIVVVVIHLIKRY